jgi:hypothetical protein
MSRKVGRSGSANTIAASADVSMTMLMLFTRADHPMGGKA